MILQKVSPSQISLFQECPRKWYEVYVLGNRIPPSKAQQKGTDIHKLVENYAEGLPLEGPLLPLVQPALTYLPSQAELKDWAREHEIWLDTFEGGPRIHGFIDLMSPPSVKMQVLDYKTTSDFKYAKSGVELEQNIQMMLYAKAAVDAGASSVELSHLYIKTKGSAAALLAHTTVSRAEVLAFFEKILETIREMVELAKQGKEAAAQNKDACNNYGGCYFKFTCFPIGGVKGLLEMPTLSEKWASRQKEVAPKDSPSVESKVSEAQGAGVENAAPLVDDSPPAPTTLVSEDSVARSPRKRKAQDKTVSNDVVTDTATGLHLYLDCFPCKGRDREAAVLFEDWIAPYAKRVAEDSGVDDYRLLDFGKGKVALANVVRKNLSFVPKVLVVSSFSPGSNEILDVLIPQAELFVRKI